MRNQGIRNGPTKRSGRWVVRGLLACAVSVGGLAVGQLPASATDCDAIANPPTRVLLAAGSQVWIMSGNGGMFCPSASVTSITTSLTVQGANFGEMQGVGTKNAFATATTACPSTQSSWRTTALGAGASPTHNDNASATSAAVTYDCSLNVEPPRP